MDCATLSIRKMVPRVARAETKRTISIRRYLVEGGHPSALCCLGQHPDALSEVLRVAIYSFVYRGSLKIGWRRRWSRLLARPRLSIRRVVGRREKRITATTHQQQATEEKQNQRQLTEEPCATLFAKEAERRIRLHDPKIASARAKNQFVHGIYLLFEATAFRRLPLNQGKDGRNGLTVTEFIRATHSEARTEELRYPKYSIGVATLQLALIVGAVEVSFGLAD